VPLHRDIVNLTLAIICQAAFGFRIKDRDDGDDVFQHFCQITDEVIERLNDPTDWWYLLHPYRSRPASLAIEALDKIIHGMTMLSLVDSSTLYYFYADIVPSEVITERQRQRELQKSSSSVEESKDSSPDHDDNGPRDLIDILLDAADIGTNDKDKQQSKDGSSKALSYQHIRDHAMTFFLAGFDTTSGAISWILYELSLHPEIQVIIVIIAELSITDLTS
jgi:cytochrome P450